MGVARPGIRMLAVAAIAIGTLGAQGVVGSTAAVAADASCSDGVTVVVDFSDLTVDGKSGTVEVGCAPGDPQDGRAALTAAGFTATDSQPGFLCAIDSRPDPCPETFDGSFWAYWHATPQGEWTSYQVGADASDPVPGQIEGWRYNDGTTPPGIAPAEVAAALAAGPAQTGSDQSGSNQSSADQNGTGTPSTDQAAEQARAQAAQGLALTVTAIGFLAVIVALVVIFAVRARHRGPGASD
ncbi:hypothetical protein [Terrimesophilobacter mesophilus]|nr:hypothetical protein [Terrimesophilobacter mesophilus]